MRVLRVGMTYPRDIEPGVGQHAFYHAKCSKNEELIITSKRPGKIVENRLGVRVVEIEFENTGLGAYSDRGITRIKKLLKKLFGQIVFLSKAKPFIDEYKPDLVHVYSPIPIMCGLYSRKKYNSKVVVSLHGSDALRISKNPYMKILLDVADAIVSVSESMEEQLSSLGLKKEIKCIGNGVDLDVFRDFKEKREKQFIHVGSLRWQKGQQYLLEAFALFCEKYDDYSMEIIGIGEREKELKCMCKELGIAEKVFFMGTQGRQAVAKEMNKSKAFVLTSVSEGFPKVIIEAMATGTPVISTDVGNIKSVVGNAGIVVPSGDVVAIYNSMVRLVNDSELWNFCSFNSKERASSYSWKENTRRLEEVYEDVLK